MEKTTITPIIDTWLDKITKYIEEYNKNNGRWLINNWQEGTFLKKLNLLWIKIKHWNNFTLY